MTGDARFEDGRERPVNLGAMDVEDLQVLSALVQDAVLSGADLKWVRKDRQFVALINRFRWEEGRAEAERVRSLLVVSDVVAVASQGIARDGDTVLSLLSVSFEPGEDGTGYVHLTLAGDGALRITVEALDVRLKDVTRPYAAPSGKAPTHPE
ncbi:DUF2948 family protein [Pseudaestuariivita atlantica]|uniref:DUF2948 domain-containing protein n=1 Tax=Pseudaestuariivita atlantica TaxID=1317121 RepID=A0A0L1JU86_9RHOB|nr:DUF2948 family protein [Pseudaestuariivita atlantica]KNG95262.1 hypothetical protein ATO11_01095 [Pseudaestuariivita atlantica]